MPSYATVQAGSVKTALIPGDGPLFLFNAEVVAAGEASISFARGPSPSSADNGTTFTFDWAAAPTATINVQVANQDVDADYRTVFSTVNQQHDNYTDVGRAAFYRVQVSAFSAGGVLTAIAQR